MLGMSLATFTLLHVLISLIGSAAGVVAAFGWLKADPSRTSTAVFLAATILTSVTGFFFPAPKLLPSHVVGLISLAMLALATFAYYGRHLSSIWRPIFAITAVLSLYLNVFVLLIQSFLKIPLLTSWAPTQTEPAFLAVQGSALVVFIVLAILTTLRFRPTQLAAI
jgi:hypothetical protein